MHSTYAIDIVRQKADQAEARAELAGQHLAALRAVCRRARGLRGIVGGCARV